MGMNLEDLIDQGSDFLACEIEIDEHASEVFKETVDYLNGFAKKDFSSHSLMLLQIKYLCLLTGRLSALSEVYMNGLRMYI